MQKIHASLEEIEEKTDYSVEELQEYRVLVACLMLRYGPRLVVLLDRIERELQAARKEDPLTRARAVLEEEAKKRRMRGGRKGEFVQPVITSSTSGIGSKVSRR